MDILIPDLDFTSHPGLLALFILFAFTLLVQLVYYWIMFSRLAFYRAKRKPEPTVPVSVVVCAKNEAHNLRKNLPLILSQNYPAFEVVIVNDSSDDDTADVLEDFANLHQNLKVIHIPQNLNFFSGKKFPLSLGIKSASYEHLLLTDADCRPVDENWIWEFASAYGHGTEIVLGYGPYERRRSLLNLLIRYETLHAALQYLSYALSGIPYMGVGRNLSYKKSLFYRNKGFISHYTIKSGDDDLFINQTATGRNTRIEISRASQTISRAKRSFGSWWGQKRRHLTTSRHYKFRHKLLLGLYSLSHTGFYLLFALLLAVNYNIVVLLPLFCLRLITQLVIVKKSMTRLSEKNLLLISPFLDVALAIINPSLAFSNLVKRQHKWK